MILPAIAQIRRYPAQKDLASVPGFSRRGMLGMMLGMAGALSQLPAWFSQNRYPSPLTWSGPFAVRSGPFFTARAAVFAFAAQNPAHNAHIPALTSTALASCPGRFSFARSPAISRENPTEKDGTCSRKS